MIGGGKNAISFILMVLNSLSEILQYYIEEVEEDDWHWEKE
jgi:hypothetical protein